VEDLVGSALAAVARQAQGREILVEVADDLPPVPVDYVLMRQALVNVLDNALKYSPAGTSISVTAKQVENEVWLEVVDSGPGIAREQWTRVVEPFERGVGPDAPAGTGLGLSIARGIVQAHRGQLRLNPSPTGGAAITLVVPLAGSAAPLPPNAVPKQ
jgi:two-component system sensor histidine kinase KdpD